MNLSPLLSLTERWRAEADLLRRRGAPGQADLLQSAAAELEERVQEYRNEPLTPVQAASESGYTANHIRRLIRQGTLPNAGEGDELRVRRHHLPRKPGYRTGGSSPAERVGSRSRVARTVVESD